VRCALLAAMAAAAATAAAAPPGWVEVDYGALVDRRQPTHSGESVGEILQRLGGRPVPPAEPPSSDRVAHGNIEPFLEGHAFILPDLVDARRAAPERPLTEVGWLWAPGQAQPAWAELLRARRYVVESDGRGYLRVFVPAREAGAPGAAEAAWTDAWPVLRHVLAAERARLAAGKAPPPALAVDVYAYTHHPERTAFLVSEQPTARRVTDTRPDGRRPPLDLAALHDFLAAGLRLEGARLEPDGDLRLFGSRVERRPSLLGRPLALSDFAVAYRAVFHGGLAEPYMSLDRGFGPQASVVNYGGRLRDTSLGWVSLLCDVRFKTFSLGLEIATGADLRERIRRALPGFRTHLEHLAAHPDAKDTASQQTRLWFYPDQVDLTTAPEGDVLVLRRVRLSAASERVQDAAAARAPDPPWTQDAVAAINRDYEALAGLFPELADLDEVVRLLGLFTWLRRAELDGLRVPELDALLALELPQLYTPRDYPQLLAFNAVPAAGTAGAVSSYDRVPVAEALGRLNPTHPPPTVWDRFRRALAGLDSRQPDQAALAGEMRAVEGSEPGDTRLDLLAYRAERLTMHHRVLTTLGPEQRVEQRTRLEAGERLRFFSVAIGGLDLGLGKVLERARGRRLSPQPAAAGAAPGAPREAWRSDPPGLPVVVLPDHGEGGGPHREGKEALRTILGASRPEVRARTVLPGAEGKAAAFERVEDERLLRYRIEPRAGGFAARLDPVPAAPPQADPPPAVLPGGLVLLELAASGPAAGAGIALRLTDASGPASAVRTVEAEFPRAVLQRLVLGPDVDASAGQPLAGLSPLPADYAAARVVMVLAGSEQWLPPWVRQRSPLPGEEDPLVLARALGAWWGRESTARPAAVVGVDAGKSPGRFAAAPAVDRGAVLVLPRGALAGPHAEFESRLRAAWSPGRVVEEWPEPGATASLVVVVGAEPPGLLAERLVALARAPALRGRLLAAVCLSGPLRRDLPAELLAAGNLAGFGLAEASIQTAREIEPALAELARALRAGTARPERLPGPILWYF